MVAICVYKRSHRPIPPIFHNNNILSYKQLLLKMFSWTRYKQ